MSDYRSLCVCMQLVGLKLKEKYSCILYPWFILVNLLFFPQQFYDKIVLQNGLGFNPPYLLLPPEFWNVWKPQLGMSFTLEFLFSVYVAKSFQEFYAVVFIGMYMNSYDQI